MRRASRCGALFPLFLVTLALAGIELGIPAGAQQTAPPPPPGQQAPAGQKKDDQFKIQRDVNLVVLHATVLDDRGRFVSDLKQDNFRVFEDRVEQKLSIVKREDVPVSMGLVIDNSGSMRDKRERVNTAALTFVRTSNPDDEAFVVNFNDDFFLDTDKDFTSDVGELKEALERVDSRGSTAFYDALIGSLDHLKKGHRDKKVLLVITDGEDNASRKNLEATVHEVQQSDAVVYAIGLLGQENKRSAKRARKALEEIAQASGGLAYFPEGVGDTEAICTQIAHDIRNQYTLGYYPSNTNKDGSFRAVQVEVIPPRGRGKLSVRTRSGYYAQKAALVSGGN
jgi:Ca-activated chloride channel family protein